MNSIQKILLPLTFLLLFVELNACAQPVYRQATPLPLAQLWADSVYNSLSEEERIGQLFMVAAYSGGKAFNQDKIETLLRKRQIGGLIFMQGTAEKQAALTNSYQALANVPLMIAMDAEWGLGMRLAGISDFPKQMMLGATADTSLAYALGIAIAYQCQRLGVHIDFAPVVDVNNNPNNPVINMRSFGEDKHLVAKMGIAYMNGLQDGGVMACAKHFPGHGDTDADSHKDLPVITKSRAQLDTLEMFPFRQMIAAGVQSMMVAHLDVASLEAQRNVPTSLSHNVVTNILKNELGFKGLVFTDALEMKGVTKYFAAGDADLRAFEAGADVLLMGEDVGGAIQKIKSAITTGRITPAQLEARVKKILLAKYNLGLHKRPATIDENNITEDINKYTAALNAKIAEKAITMVRNNGDAGKWKNDNRKTLYISVNGSLNATAKNLLETGMKQIDFLRYQSGSMAPILASAKSYNRVVVGVHGLRIYPGGNYGLSADEVAFIQKMAAQGTTTTVIFGNAYALRYACASPTLLVAYDDTEATNVAAAQALLGTISASGKLPVTPPCLKK